MAARKTFTVDDLFANAETIKTGSVLSKKTQTLLRWPVASAWLKEHFGTSDENINLLRELIFDGSEVVRKATDELEARFGPLVHDEEQTEQNYYSFGDIAALIRQEWFHADANSASAKERLKHTPKNTWLARLTHRDPQGFGLTVVKDSVEVEHYVIAPTKNPSNRKEVLIFPEGNEALKSKPFKDIHVLLEHFRSEPLPDGLGPLAQSCFTLDGNVVLGKKLGAGAFGAVYRAVWRRFDGQKFTEIPAAAKTLQAPKEETAKPGKKTTAPAVKKTMQYGSNDADDKLIAEGNITRGLDHPNLVKFFGYANIEGSRYIVTELLEGGSVEDFLKEKQKTEVSPTQLLSIAKDACKGMAFLHEKGIIHRDLAARNLLLVSPTDLTAKVGDFGLARLVDVKYNKTGQTGDPIRWAGPETFGKQSGTDVFKNHCTFASDVWSFGVLFWELFTFCRDMPYPAIPNAVDFKRLIASAGDVLAHVSIEDPKAVQRIVVMCLNYNESARPTFEELIKEIDKLTTELESQDTWQGVDALNAPGQVTDTGYDPVGEEYDQNEDEEKEE